MVWTLYEDFKKVIKLLINDLVLYEGSEKSSKPSFLREIGIYFIDGNTGFPFARE